MMMDGSVEELKSIGIDVEMETYEGLGHGAVGEEIESVVDFIKQALA